MLKIFKLCCCTNLADSVKEQHYLGAKISTALSHSDTKPFPTFPAQPPWKRPWRPSCNMPTTCRADSALPVIIRAYIRARFITLFISPHKAKLNEINFSHGIYTRADLLAWLGRAAATAAAAIHSTANHLPFVLHSSAVVWTSCLSSYLQVRSHIYRVEHTASWHVMTLLIKSHDGPGPLKEFHASALLARASARKAPWERSRQSHAIQVV